MLKRKCIKTPVSDHEVQTMIKNPELIKERRRQIIDAAVKLFVQYGYHKTTTRMIARASKFSIGSLYEYVSSKEDILYLVCKTIHEDVLVEVEKAMKGSGNGVEQLFEIICQYFYICDKMADHILLMYQVTQFLPEKWQKRVLNSELGITDIFVGALSTLAGKNGFPKLDESTLTLAGHNICVLGQMWTFRRWQVQKTFTIDEYIEIQTDFILGILLQ